MSTIYTGLAKPMSVRPDVVPPTVFIVDDDISVRESLESLIRHEGFDVKSFVSATSFLAHPNVLSRGCMLLDIALPGLTGLELQKALTVERPAMPIIFITGHDDAPTIVKAMKGGAVEFLTKPFDDEALLEAIRAAVERSEMLVRRESRKSLITGRYGELTRREKEVLSLIAEGLLNREIGDELGISEITVKTHRGQVMRKMEAESFAELVRMAGEIGMV